jgi:hypothetical protein
VFRFSRAIVRVKVRGRYRVKVWFRTSLRFKLGLGLGHLS